MILTHSFCRWRHWTTFVSIARPAQTKAGRRDADYWRDKLDEIPWPSGRVGRPNEMEGGKRVQVYLDAESLAIANKLGSGNVSEGIRKALKQAE